jgi:hypothetical protein
MPLELPTVVASRLFDTEGADIVFVMLIVGLIFCGVIALGQLSKRMRGH